jgi:hypothetical protein
MQTQEPGRPALVDAHAALHVELLGVLTALWFDIDHHDGASASSFFTADGELRFEASCFTGTAAIDNVYRRRAERGPRLSRHVVTNLHIEEVADDAVHCLSTLLLFAEDGHAPSTRTSPTLVADVWDQFTRVDGRWLIGSRWIKNQFIPDGENLAVPLK